MGIRELKARLSAYIDEVRSGETLRVVLKEGSDEAFIETSLARDSLPEPGMRVVISELKFDPTPGPGGTRNAAALSRSEI